MELIAERIVAGGDAIARVPDGRVALIEGALPGERVRVTTVQDRADFLRARVEEVLEPSAAHVEMPCRFARAGCGGCTWQFVAVDAQPALLRDIAADTLRRQARCEDPPLQDTIALPAEGYRTTVRALVVDGRPAFRKRHSHEPVVVDDCLVAHPLVDDILQHGRFGTAAEVTVRAGANTGERCVYTEPIDLPVEVAADVAVGKLSHYHEEIGGHRFRISAPSFFQVRADGAELLARLVREAVGPDRRVADLYCGVGLFSALIDSPRSVVAVERGRSAVADARVNLRELGAKVVRSDVAKWRGNDIDVVIADPSRTGLQRGGVSAVLRCEPERVVLVSCDAAALGRDVGLLMEDGFRLTSVTPIALFPHTPHLECVTILDR